VLVPGFTRETVLATKVLNMTACAVGPSQSALSSPPGVVFSRRARARRPVSPWRARARHAPPTALCERGETLKLYTYIYKYNVGACVGALRSA
jgi:hypothetical protein